jgi:hypothetical protein
VKYKKVSLSLLKGGDIISLKKLRSITKQLIAGLASLMKFIIFLL